MYPFDAWRGATEALWEDVRSAMPDLPPLAPWSDDVHMLWRDPDLVVSQACGWPLATELEGTVRTVGAFRYRTAGWSGHQYRSVIVGRDGAAGRDLTGARAAVNGLDSLSGWVSLVWSVGMTGGGAWPGPVTITGSHLASLRAIGNGSADVASIDALTHAHVARDRPELLRGVVTIGSGPLVPCLPVIAAGHADDAFIDALRTALAAAAARRSDATTTLMIDGFTPFDTDAYVALRELAPSPQ